MPEEVTATVLGVAHMYSLTVEGSPQPDIPHAVRFARRLARSLGGAVVDQQSGQVWARGASRVTAKPQRDQRVSVIRITWYSRQDDVEGDAGRMYTALCRRLLPEALPRRFGEFEPLQGRLADVGDDGFAGAWRDATPCIGGWMSAGPNEPHPHRVWDMTVDVHYEPLGAAVWRDAVRRLFISMAEHLNAFYPSAEVTRDNIWTGRSMWVDGNTEWPISPARREGWMGLPPYPVWWAWYGTAYRDLVQSHPLRRRVVHHDRGVLHELADEPLDRDQLKDLVNAPWHTAPH